MKDKTDNPTSVYGETYAAENLGDRLLLKVTDDDPNVSFL